MKEIPQSSRLFLPLTSQAFEWYNLGKDIEVRKFSGRFKNIFARSYNFAELRKGYSGEAMLVSITKIVQYQNPQELFNAEDYRRIVPIANSRLDAEEKIFSYVGNDALLAIFIEKLSH